jgi:hypothetical protein
VTGMEITDAVREQVTTNGQLAARLGLPVDVCPWAAQQTPAERALARIWVSAFLATRPPVPGEVDYDDAGETARSRVISRRHRAWDAQDHPRHPGGAPGGRGGQFAGEAGLIFETDVKLPRGQSVRVGAFTDEASRLAIGDTAIRLSPEQVEWLRRQGIYSYELENVGDRFTILEHDQRDGGVYSRLRLLATKTGLAPEDPDGDDDAYYADELTVRLAPNDDPTFEELEAAPGVRLTARQLVTLTERLQAMQAGAARLDVGEDRQLDLFHDGRRTVLRQSDGPELALSRREWRALMRALDQVVEAYESEENTEPLPADATSQRTISTSAGEVTVRQHGEDGRLELHLGTAGVITIEADRVLAFFSRLGHLNESMTRSRPLDLEFAA